MPRLSTLPTLFDEVKSISISDLNKWNYLKEGSCKSGTVTWSRNGIKTSSISISVSINKNSGNLFISYTCDNKPYNYNVNIVPFPSNLGKGNIWYFICPFTNRRCKKLHFISERFMHRSALPSGMYSKQTHSKKWRFLEKHYGAYFDSEKNYQELYSKYFTKYYRGRPTKRYKKLMEKINAYEQISHKDIEKLYLM